MTREAGVGRGQAPAFRGAPSGGFRAGGPSLRSREREPARRRLVRRALVLGTPAALHRRRDRHREHRLARLDDAGRAGELCARGSRSCWAAIPTARSLAEALGRDLWIDFVADTGDDVAVSRAVARLVFAPYELPDPDRPGRVPAAPRGDILFFGGDTAYPVATAQEILNRVIVPWNQVLRGAARRRRDARVLLGIPGNHDWYDGLDGFGAHVSPAARPASNRGAPVVGVSPLMLRALRGRGRASSCAAARSTSPQALVLSGYTPVQNASYFALPLAPAHRPARGRSPARRRSIPRQRTSSASATGPPADSATLVVTARSGVPLRRAEPDGHADGREPAPRPDGARDLRAERRHPPLRARSSAATLLHVIAGGGGAFLHPARIAKGGLTPKVAWPGVAQSRRLLRDVPWKLACGRSGFLPHFALLLIFAPAVLFGGQPVRADRAWCSRCRS